MYKIIAISLICFALLAFGFTRWKKKYRHTNRPFKAGDKRPQTANFDIGRAIEWERTRGTTVDGTKRNTTYTYGYFNIFGQVNIQRFEIAKI